MTNCLLCHNKLTPYFQFSDIFLSRKPRETVCTDCWRKFEVISDRHCQICYQPDIDGTCYDCQQVTEPIRTVQFSTIMILQRLIFKPINFKVILGCVPLLIAYLETV